jgi:hypothetical protein
MTHEHRTHEIARKRVVYRIPGAAAPVVHRDVPYSAADGEPRVMDIYLPPARIGGNPIPAVFFVTGFPDRGVRSRIGCNAKDMLSYVSWAGLCTASGLAAITCTLGNPVTDVLDAMRFLREHAGAFGIDGQRVGVWACSGNVPNALGVLMDAAPRPVCAAFLYGYMPDLEGRGLTQSAAETFGFVNPCAGRGEDCLRSGVPLFMVRAGRDEMPHLNETLDRFVANALELNLPMTLVNHDRAPHAFDLTDESEATRDVILQVLAFLRFHLHGPQS